MNTNTPTAADPQSSTSVSPSTASISSLQRGKACLPCRRRKMKCDGARPVCSPCLRGERVEDCEYTDGQRRPRTLTLEEDIARLRARVQELENPGTAIPSVELHAPYEGAGAGASGVTNASASASQARVQASFEPPQVSFEADVHFHARRALSVIAPHAPALGFFLNIDRLRVGGTYVLPALQSALTLWSVHIASTSEPDPAQAHERTKALAADLLARTQTQLALILNTVDAEPDSAILLHVIQAGVLLAYYMQRIGQVVGAKYYASGTWALVMMLRLYRRPRLLVDSGGVEGMAPQGSGLPENPNTDALTRMECVRLAPALDGIEAEERVRAFWTVYALDRWFGVVCEIPSQSFTTEGGVGSLVAVPWPGVGGVDEPRSNAVQRFLNDPTHDFTQEGASAMYAKASVLLGEVTGLSTSFTADRTVSQSSAFRTRFGTLDALLQRCLSTAMTMATASQGGQSQTQEQAQALVTIHLIALAHVILHRPFVSTYRPSRRRSVEGALVVVRVLDRLGEVGLRVGSTSPIYVIVWTGLCLALHDEVLRLRAESDADPSRHREVGEMVAAIRKLVCALSTLSQRCPSWFFAVNIETVLPILGSFVG